MSTVIKVDNLSKSYLIGHQKSDRYLALRDVLAHKARSMAQRIRHPLSPNKETVQLEEFWALKNINLEIKQGERVGIIGPNGAGKSTLLKILSRITEPTKGGFTLNGRVASLLEVGTGFHPELSGRENIYLNGAVLGMGKKEIKQKFDEIVTFAEVEKFLDTPVKRYSSGMYVRLAFAVAAHLEPEILIVDEVLAVGDAQFQKKCLGKLGDVSSEGRTVLFVSHNMNAVQALCSKAVLLSDGKIEKEGSCEDVITDYLKSFEASQAVTAFEPDNGKDAQIRKVSMYNQNGELSNVFDLNEKFTIRVDYELNKEITGLSVGLQIISGQTNQCLISLPDPELDSSRLGKRKKGYYQGVVEIPDKLLNTGFYRVKTGMTCKREVFDVIESVNFTIVDRVGIVQCLGNARKNALLSVQLPWTIQYFTHEEEASLD